MTLLAIFSFVELMGAAMVILGVVLEEAERIVNLGSNMKFRSLLVQSFGKRVRDMLVFTARFSKPRVKSFEALGFIMLVLGLCIELIGSGEKSHVQSNENSALESENSTLSQKLIDSNNEINSVREKNADLATKLNESNIKLDASIKEGVDLEESLAPRTYKHMGPSIARLKAYSGTEFVIATTPDDPYQEALGLSNQITTVLTQANWIQLQNDVSMSHKLFESNNPGEYAFLIHNMFPGVRIELESGVQKTDEAANALVKELGLSHIIANRVSELGDRPPNVVVIKIGRRPDLDATRELELEEELMDSHDQKEEKELLEQMRNGPN